MEALARAFPHEESGDAIDAVAHFPAREFKVYTHRQLDRIRQVQALPEAQQFEIKVVSQVLPFRVNEYVLEELIDWDNIPGDPMFRLLFPQREMLKPEDFDAVAELVRREASACAMAPTRIPPGRWTSTCRCSTASPCRACSTSIARPCCFSPARARCATATARSASAGHSSWATRSCASPPARPTSCTTTWQRTRRSATCWSPAEIRW